MTLETLKGKTIVLAVTGSIAAVETVKLARELRRKGAEVHAVMSRDACGIITPDALVYATGNPAIERITGFVEHVAFCGEGGKADLLLIAPCTANTIGKIACGIDDTPPTSFATTALGSRMPVVVAPAMHESMYRHPAVEKNLEILDSFGIDVIPPKMEENRAKMPDIATIVLHAERAVMGSPLAGKRVLVTSGACREPLDDVRVLTTRSSGRMGKAIALQAYRLGADVTIVHNDTIPCVKNIHTDDSTSMHDAVTGVLDSEGADYYISAAAISDYAPERHEGKIPSGEGQTIALNPLPKLIDRVLDRGDIRVVAFKMGWDERESAERLLDAGAAMVVMNTPDAMGGADGTFTLLKKDAGPVEIRGSKEEVAGLIWENLP